MAEALYSRCKYAPGHRNLRATGLAPEKGKQTKIWGTKGRVIVRVEPEPLGKSRTRPFCAPDYPGATETDCTQSVTRPFRRECSGPEPRGQPLLLRGTGLTRSCSKWCQNCSPDCKPFRARYGGWQLGRDGAFHVLGVVTSHVPRSATQDYAGNITIGRARVAGFGAVVEAERYYNVLGYSTRGRRAEVVKGSGD